MDTNNGLNQNRYGSLPAFMFAFIYTDRTELDRNEPHGNGDRAENCRLERQGPNATTAAAGTATARRNQRNDPANEANRTEPTNILDLKMYLCMQACICLSM